MLYACARNLAWKIYVNTKNCNTFKIQEDYFIAKKICDLCQSAPAVDMRFGVNLCNTCVTGYDKAMEGDTSCGKHYSNPSNFPSATELAKLRIIKFVADKHTKMAEIAEAEQHRQQFAKSFDEFYEYDVVTILNEGHGKINKEKMIRILNERSQLGWKLHTIYSNELGKNALSLMGLGVNSTACEDVLIFERRVEKF